ncbi:MAG: Rho termination factor N-terminal domain-containing protein [Nocardioidaceae bacterium]
MSTKTQVTRLAGQARRTAGRFGNVIGERTAGARQAVARTGPGAAVDERMRRIRLPGRRSQTRYDAELRAQEKSNRRVQDAERRLAKAQQDLVRARELAGGGTASARRTSGQDSVPELETLTKKELLEQAAKLDVTGRSRMSKSQLIRALRTTGQA